MQQGKEALEQERNDMMTKNAGLEEELKVKQGDLKEAQVCVCCVYVCISSILCFINIMLMVYRTKETLCNMQERQWSRKRILWLRTLV